MNIISLIPSYNPKDTTNIVLSELMKVSTRVIVFTKEDNASYPFDSTEVVSVKNDIGHNLVFEPRKWILNHLHDEWDYVLYNEDDILLSESSIRNAIGHQSKLSYPVSIGFNRFERLKGEKYWIDQHPDHGIHTGRPGTSIFQRLGDYWIPSNFHSGNFLLSKDYINRLISDGRFDTFYKDRGISYCGTLESGATSVYRTIVKVLPLEFESVECEHLTNKYCFIPPTPTTTDLKKLLHG